MERDTQRRTDHNPSPADLDPEQTIPADETYRADVDRPLGARADLTTMGGTAVVAPDISVSPRPISGAAIAEPTAPLSASDLRDIGVSPDPMAAGVDAATLERVQANEAAGATAVDAPPDSIPETHPVTAITDETGHTTAQLNVQAGAEVVGLDGEKIGEVRAIRMGDFLVHRPLFSKDVYVPFECVQEATGDRVTLTIPAGEVGDQGWAHPN